MYSVDVLCSEDLTFQVSSKDFKISIDAKGEGISPLQAMLAALAACTGVYIREFMEGIKQEIGEFSIAVSAELTEKPPYRFAKINIDVDLKGVLLDESRQASLQRFIKNCPVHQTLKGNPEIVMNLAGGDKD